MAQEKILTINLRKNLVKGPKWERSKDAMSLLRKKVAKLSSTGYVEIDKKLNEKIWARGGKKPVTKLRVKVTKLDDGSVKAELME